MLGILCGLGREAALARRMGDVQVACAGARPQQARWLARELIKKGVKRLMSFGVAGGLEPGLPVGTLVLGTQVASRDGVWTCDTTWLDMLMQKLPSAHCGGVWGSELLIANATEKRRLYEKSRCLVVDMESQCAAQVAAEAGVPFAVMRAVCDSSDMAVPPAILAAIAEDGAIDYKGALFSLLRRPQQIPTLVRIACGMNKAMSVLKKSVGAVGD